MSVNKNALLRYRVLDKCFKNFSRKYYFDDLLDNVNEVLLYEDSTSGGIQTRQLREDIRFMKSESGYSAPIEMFREGRKGYYRYTDPHFSINNTPLTPTEVEKLKSALVILQRLSGKEEFEWMNELAPLLQDQLGLLDVDKKVMSYESNIDYAGYSMISPAFEAIINKVVLRVVYKPFSGDSYDIIFHPYYLKQYNNRWFLFGYNESTEVDTWNLPLDRIEHIEQTDKKFIENDLDWDDYFYDIIGVSKMSEEVEEVELLFTKEQAPYVETKPIHPSQKSYQQDNGSLLVKLSVGLNFELQSQLLSFGDQVKVLKPQILSEQIKSRLKKGFDQY